MATAPYFEVDGVFRGGAFDYIPDPGADPSVVVARSFFLTDGGPIEPVQTIIYREKPPEEDAAHAGPAPELTRGPLPAIITLLFMALAIRYNVKRKP